MIDIGTGTGACYFFCFNDRFYCVMAESNDLNVMAKDADSVEKRAEADFLLSPVGQMMRKFEVEQRMAQMYSTSTIVPEVFRGNVGNCAIAIDIALRMNANPLMIMQNLDVIKGRPSFSSKFLIATINACGRYERLKFRKVDRGKVGVIDYKDVEWDPVAKKNRQVVKRFDGKDVDDVECVAYARDLKTGDVLESSPVSIRMAIQEGWYTKEGSKWRTMPDLMLSYRSAAFWARVYCPEMTVGLRTTEELEDIEEAEYVELGVDEKKAVMRGRKRDKGKEVLP